MGSDPAGRMEMALSESAVTLVRKYAGKRVLSLGYPDILATPQWMTREFSYEVKKTRNDGKVHSVKHALPDAMDFFNAIGAELTCVDVKEIRGGERICDLNYPQDLGRFDLVIDPGTLEHCFNVGQALMNAANAVDSGGHIFHISPISMVNHGFWMMSPTLYHDFYGQNGFDILEAHVVKREHMAEMPMTQRYGVASEVSMYVVARRNTLSPLKYPVQTKYLTNPDLGWKAA